MSKADENRHSCNQPCIHQLELAKAWEKIARLEKELARAKSQNEQYEKGAENMFKCLDDGFSAVGIDFSKMTEDDETPQHWLEEMANEEK